MPLPTIAEQLVTAIDAYLDAREGRMYVSDSYVSKRHTPRDVKKELEARAELVAVIGDAIKIGEAVE